MRVLERKDFCSRFWDLFQKSSSSSSSLFFFFFFFCAFRFAWVNGLRKKRFLFQVLGFVSKMDFGVLMCVLVAMVGVKRRWEWILECLARSLVDFSEFVMVVAGGLCFVGLIWVFWVVLSGLLCGW